MAQRYREVIHEFQFASWLFSDLWFRVEDFVYLRAHAYGSIYLYEFSFSPPLELSLIFRTKFSIKIGIQFPKG